MAQLRSITLIAISTLALAACDLDEPDVGDAELRAKPVESSQPQAGYNPLLKAEPRFHPVDPDDDPVRGAQLFGLNPNNLDEEDTSLALFEGFSIAANAQIVSNGRSCFTCHRGLTDRLGLRPPPMSDSVDLSDPLFTGLDADAQGDPDGFNNLEQFGLFKYRFGRFDPRDGADKPMRQLFSWRKSPQLLNLALNVAMLNDARMPGMAPTDTGAVFSHTQEADTTFNDLFSFQDSQDMKAFLFSNFTDPRLAALRDPADALHDVLLADPYYTVDITTPAQEAGREVFDEYCFTCHNMPNVFTAMDNVEPRGNGDRLENAIAWGPSVTRTYNVGVAEANFNNLRFTQFVGPGEFKPIVIQLAREDGGIVDHEVTFDVGLAASTARYVDVGRFKVPQLRNLKNNAPYFHDNSVHTIPEIVEYFTSDHYNSSADGQHFPIHLTEQQKLDLIEFLNVL